MVPNDIWLRTEWLSCRRTSVLRCVERYCAAAAREYRRALRRVQEVEEMMAQVEPETGRRLPSQPAQAELLNRRLAAANAEIRRYQTRLYACEREMVALRQENAELEALCEQARANSLLPPVPPQPNVLEQPGLPVIVFHPAADAPKAEQPQPDVVPEQSAPEQKPALQAAPPEPEEERCPFAQPDWKPTTALDHQAVDLVHQLESLMTV